MENFVGKLTYDEVKRKLNKYGIIVHENGQIEYDQDQSGMKLRLPKVYLLRHSCTQGTDTNVFMSDDSENSHLTQKGIQRIRNGLNGFCKENDIDTVIVCSDIPRVVETADVLREVNPDTPFIFEKEYKGINNGGWEGHTNETLTGEELEQFIEREEKHNIFAKSSRGESWAQVLLNSAQLINMLNKKYENKKVLLVSQGSILRGIDILTRKNSDPWFGYDAKRLYNFEKANSQDNYGKVALVQDQMIENDGMIHGRFQTFHKGHFEEHFKRALSRVPRGHKLYVGITKPFKTDSGTSVGDDHRDSSDSNPYTFEQRREMVLKSVEMDSEVSDRLNDIIVIPWPLNNNQELEAVCDAFFPDKSKVTQFMNVIPGDGWEYEKKRMLEGMGFRTVNLVNADSPRLTCATDVRGLKNHPQTYKTQMKYTSERPLWEELVPKGTATVIKRIDEDPSCIPQRFTCVKDFLDSLPKIDANSIARHSLAKNPEEQETVDGANSVLEDLSKEEPKDIIHSENGDN